VSSPDAADRVVILDRDGTLVIDRGYLDDPAGLEFEPGAAEALRRLYSHRYRLVVISNQSGVGRGYFALDTLEAMNARLAVMVREAGARLEGIYTCPHAPRENCDCRKPAVGLMTRAAADLGFNPASAIVIGDKETDVEFGRNAGAMTVLIAADGPPPTIRVRPDVVAPNLLEAARSVIALRD
jgi:D-glycero-D-manno-heptose 1,7-bisphosphate phosphatase